jgi:transposase
VPALTVTVVKRTDDIGGFVVLPRRWVVERSFGWLNRHRRLVRDYERLPEHVGHRHDHDPAARPPADQSTTRAALGH